MIHLECDNDEALVRALGFPKKFITHHAGKPRVAKALKESQANRVVGLVDEDVIGARRRAGVVAGRKRRSRVRRLSGTGDLGRGLIVRCP